MQNRKANLFIVGAMKAGTTSFIEMLSQHPEIYVSPVKEPHYFLESLPKNIYEPSRFFNLDTYFEKDFPEPLHIATVSKEVHYKKLFSLAKEEHKYLAEASTGYLHDPKCAQNIFDYNPEAKIIILLRDPLKRAFSHYKMNLGLGRTTQTFQKAIDEELRDYENGTLSNWSYLGMSLYAKNVKRYRDIFGSKVLLMNIAAFNSQKEVEINKLNSFLKIAPHQIDLQKNNASKSLRFQKFFFVLKQSGIKDLFSFILPKKFRHKVFEVVSKKESLSLELESNTQKRIEEIFLIDQKQIT